MKTLARERDKDDLIARLRGVRPDSTRRWGRMSAQQMICHVGDALAMVTGEKPTPDTSSWLRRSAIKWFALYAPMPWPPGISTIPELDAEQGCTKPAEFAADVARVERLLQKIAGQERIVGMRHPLFGPMSHADWLRWAYLHTHHHLRQFGA